MTAKQNLGDFADLLAGTLAASGQLYVVKTRNGATINGPEKVSGTESEPGLHRRM
jgi:uncharacterized protein with beta-barrel porin domain